MCTVMALLRLLVSSLLVVLGSVCGAGGRFNRLPALLAGSSTVSPRARISVVTPTSGAILGFYRLTERWETVVE